MEGHSGCSVLCALTSLLLLIPLLSGGSAEEFSVIGPPDPIVAVLGGDIALPCRVIPAMSVESLELRWFRSQYSKAVLIYRNRQEQRDELMAQYAGRTSLDKQQLSQGVAAVRIHEVRASDNGLYSCFFRKGRFYEEASLELKVAGVGSAPHVRITGPEEDGVRVACTAAGWFPKPQVQWRDLSGEKVLGFSEAHAQDTDGLFSVEAALVMRDHSTGNVTCSVLNPVLGQEKAMAIFIPEPFFPQASPWRSAFLVTMTALGLSLLGAACYTKRERSTKLRELQEQAALHQAKAGDRLTMEEARKATGELQAQLDWRKKVYLTAWRKAPLYADWRKEKFQAWPVTLDPGSAHPNLVLSHEKTRVTWNDTCKDSCDSCSVLGLEGITSGRCHWEVAIRSASRSAWALGVCSEGVRRTGWYRESPNKGFWVVGSFETGFCACTVPYTTLSLTRVPHRVGVFLDYNKGDVSFYNMADNSHIFSFPPASFSGTLFPYFVLKSGDMSLTVCPMGGGPPKKSPSWEPGSPPGVGFGSGSSAEGAESPLLPCIPDTVPPSLSLTPPCGSS